MLKTAISVQATIIAIDKVQSKEYNTRNIMISKIEIIFLANDCLWCCCVVKFLFFDWVLRCVKIIIEQIIISVYPPVILYVLLL